MTQREIYIRDFFENNSFDTLSNWSDNLKYFYFKRAARGYTEETNDCFYCLIKDVSLNGLKCFLEILNIKTIELEKDEQEINTLNRSDDNLFYYGQSNKMFKWVKYKTFFFYLGLNMDSILELRIPSHINERGSKLTEIDFKNCLYLESIIEKVNLTSHVDRTVEKFDNVFTKDKFPELK